MANGIDVVRVIEAKIRQLTSMTQKAKPSIPRQSLPSAHDVATYARYIHEVEQWIAVRNFLANVHWHDLENLGFTVPPDKAGTFIRATFRSEG